MVKGGLARVVTVVGRANGWEMECMNGVLNQYLRNLVGVDQGDWADYVGRA